MEDFWAQLEAELLASLTWDGRGDLARSKEAILVGDRGQSSLAGRVLALAAENNILRNDVTDFRARLTENGLLANIRENRRLNERLGSHAAVEAGIHGVIVLAVHCVSSRTIVEEERTTDLKMWAVPNRRRGPRLRTL